VAVGSKHAARLAVEIPLDLGERQTTEIAGRIYRLLSEHRGETPFSFYFKDRRGRVEMNFPNVATAYSPELEKMLLSLVGQGHVLVEWAS
jgi:hypothetical protein